MDGRHFEEVKTKMQIQVRSLRILDFLQYQLAQELEIERVKSEVRSDFGEENEVNTNGMKVNKKKKLYRFTLGRSLTQST